MGRLNSVYQSDVYSPINFGASEAVLLEAFPNSTFSCFTSGLIRHLGLPPLRHDLNIHLQRTTISAAKR